MKTRHLIVLAASLYVPPAFCEETTSAAQTNHGEESAGGISTIYSDMDMRIRLATKPNEQACSGEGCAENQAFDAQVQALGARLAQAAYAQYPDLDKKIPNFVFGVAEKKVVGSASNAKGTVILFRALQHLDLGEEAVAFIVAREMGHVIANHHKNNAKTKIFFTVLAGVLFPAVNLLSASGAAAQATTATTLLTSAASTATSYVGSEVALSRIKPTQLTEADDIALKLLEHAGWNKLDVAQALEFIAENEKSDAWQKDLHLSTQYVRSLAGEPAEDVADYEPLPDEPLPEEVLSEQFLSDQFLADSAPVVTQALPTQVAVEASPIAPQANKQAAAGENNAEKLVLANAENETPVATPKTPNAAPVETFKQTKLKSILITNESLAKDRAKAQPLTPKLAAKPAVILAKKPKTTQKPTALKAVKPKKSTLSKKPAKK